MKTLDEHIIRFFNKQKLNISVTNFYDTTRHQIFDFEAVRMHNYDMILDFSWLKDINSDIDWRTNDWRYQNLRDETKTKLNVEFVDSNTIIKKILTDTIIYIITRHDYLKKMHFFATRNASHNVDTINLSDYIMFYANLFSESLTINIFI